LGTCLWNALAPAFGPLPTGLRRVCVVADGPLARVPFSALPISGTDRMLDRVEVELLASGADLIHAASPSTPATGRPLVISSDSPTTGVVGWFRNFFGAERVDEYLRRHHRAEHRWGAAGLAAWPLMEPPPAWCHVAVPGTLQSFWSPSEKFTAYTRQLRDVLEECRQSGVRFDVNAYFDEPGDPKPQRTGWFSATHLARRSLPGTELAVFSRIMAGSGDYDHLGVLHFRHGLRTAGVRRVVHSLWAVNNDEKFWPAFYQAFTKTHSAAGALRAAQRAAVKAKVPIRDWAAFVAVRLAPETKEQPL
jgi:hypothetical protein